MISLASLIKWKARAALWAMYGGVALGLALMGFGLGYHRARVSSLQEMNALNEQRLIAENVADGKLRQKEVDHAKEVAELRVQLAKESARERAADIATIARLRDGSERLRFEVSSCRSAPGVPGDPASGGADGAGRAELAPETAAALFRIVADGDDAIRKFGKLQEWARTAVKRCSPEGAQP